MINYSEIHTYFSDKKSKSLEHVFGVFLHQKSFSGNEATLLAEFESFSVIPEDEKSTAWDILLRKTKDTHGLPVIAYALSGDISLARFNWLLGHVASILNSYEGLSFSLISIAATFGHVARLDALINAGYQPSTAELKDGLFYATYFGHQSMVEFIINKLTIPFNSLRDSDNNTPLHVAVRGRSVVMIDFVAPRDTTQLIFNNRFGYCPFDMAILSGEKSLLDKLIDTHQVCAVEIDYALALQVLAKSAVFSEKQSVLLSQFHPKYNQNITLMVSLIRDAILVGNINFIRELLHDLPLGYDLSELVSYAKTQVHQPVIFLLGEESVFRAWALALKNNLFDRYKAYVDRKPNQLLSLAQEDGYTTAYPRANITGAGTADKKKNCQDMLEKFFQDRTVQKVLKEKYHIFSNVPAQRENYSKQIVLPRQALSKTVTNLDSHAFKTCLLQAMQLNEHYLSLNQDDMQFDIHEKGTPVSSNIDDLTDISEMPSPNDYQLEPQITYTPKVRLFIDTFADQFDKTYRFYMCLSTGEILKKPDATDQLAEIAKKAADILPNVSVSAAALGIPLPLSIEFPSSVAVVAVIDVCMYLRQQHQQAGAKRIGHFFAGTTLHDRTEIIYDCAKSMAKQFYDQIEKLDNMPGGVPYFAEIAVVRLFEYMVKCDENVQSSGRSRLLTFFRKLMSTIVDVGPEPEIIQKPLSRVAGDALSIQQHLVFYKNDAEEHPLLLDQTYRDATRHDPTKKWTSKGIFEHTGIWAEDGRTYCGRNQNVEKYGYVYSTVADAKGRRMALCEKISWVNMAPQISHATQEDSSPGVTRPRTEVRRSAWVNLNFLGLGGGGVTSTRSNTTSSKTTPVMSFS